MRGTLLAVALLLVAAVAAADDAPVPIDDFEDLSRWSAQPADRADRP